MPVQPQHRFSVRDYYRMAETGVLHPGARVELLDGRIIDMSPIGPLHGGVVNRLSRFFNLKANGRWFVSSQNSIRLDEHSEPQPDVLLLKLAHDDYTNALPRPDDVYLLIEVADSTLEYDREDKLPVYARAGIAEVWIVDLREDCVEVYRDPSFTGYGTKTVILPGEQARPQSFPDVAIEVAELLKR